jgi:hypothetical protein
MTLKKGHQRDLPFSFDPARPVLDHDCHPVRATDNAQMNDIAFPPRQEPAGAREPSRVKIWVDRHVICGDRGCRRSRHRVARAADAGTRFALPSAVNVI